jgi:large repetitive protein
MAAGDRRTKMVSKRSSAQRVLGTRSQVGRWLTTALIGAAALTGPMLIASPASALNINSATFNVAYAKNGTALTLTVNTSNDTKSVKAGAQCTTANQTSWTFTSTAGSGNGTQTTTVIAYKDAGCTGNNVTVSASYILDNIAPVISGTRVPVANANGWNNTSVAVNFTCSDTNPVTTCGPNATLSTETANQSVTGNAVDAAGNTSSTTVSAIKIDLTAPTLTGAPTTAANANGWYNSNVTITWTCNDGLSGIALNTCPANSAITGEGSNLTATATVADRAGNSTTTTTSAVRIDRTAPVTSASAPPAWNNTDLTVTLSGTDALSGVASTQYSVDGGATQTGTSVLFNTDGDHVLQYWSTDRAGNTETTRSVHVKIDKTSPTISHTQSPLANSHGWNNTAVTITFTCDDTLSGIASCTAPQTVSTQGANQSRIGAATDNAGNVANDPATVSIDTTAPSITGSPDRAPNALGWYSNDVTISFSCTDALSGVDTCPGAIGLGEGPNQTAQGTSTDAAGNVATATVNNINVDKTVPTLVGSPTTSPDQNGFYRGPVTIHWTCTDALSGFASGACPANFVINGNGTGLFASAAVSDKAGNTTVASSAAVNIDASAPTTTSDAPAGWQTADVVVTLNATDAGPSGIQGTFYQLDASAAVAGTSVLVTEGKHVITFWSVDNAGNSETPHTVTVDVDESMPGISHTHVPTPNAAGWNNTNVLITFTCTDQVTLSGVATCTPSSQGVTTNGAGQTVTGTATDVAGNTASDVVTVNLDKVAPTITAAAQGSANANGWYKQPVTVNFTCLDQSGLSGVAQCSLPQTLGEGANQTASGNAKDYADNTASASVQHIDVDMTNPELSAAPTTSPNGAGWYNGDVTIDWFCGDALSGIDGPCPSPTTFTTEGTELRVGTSDTDRAGNTTNATSPPVSIDRHAPITSADAPTSWTNQSTTVHLDASDSLSGVNHTAFVLDGAAAQNGNSITIGTEGVHTLEYWSVDNAGNEEAHHTATIEIDQSNPTITASQLPGANGHGWNNSNVTVTFTCADQSGLSGIKTCTTPKSVTTDGLGQQVVGNAEDNAGNTSSTTHTVNLDKTPPTITSSISEPANGAGWHNNQVGVSFACDDGLSGVSSCVGATTLVEGENQSVTGTAVDNADNSTSTTVSNIDVDLTPPSIHGNVPAPNAGWYNTNVVVHWVCSDTLSGLASCPGDSTISGEGTSLSASGDAVDHADNIGSATVGGINIDRTAPSSSVNAPSGWSNTNVTLHVDASDNLSGIAHRYVEVDGGTATVDTDVVIGEGVHNVRFWSVDVASNVEVAKTAIVQVDKTAPTIGHTQTPTPNGAGWNNSDVAVGFVCADPLSDIASCTAPSTIVAETSGTLLTGTAVDNAGNQASNDVTVMLDKTPPSVTASADRAANGHGWYNAAVNVNFQCNDTLSGIADCPATRLLGEGAAQSATATGHDMAGNAATAGVNGINVDTTAPSLSGAPTTPPNSNGWYKGDVEVHWTCADALSGVGPCPVNSTISGEGQNFVASASVTDLAGNTTGASSAPAVQIDRTAPVTNASAPGGWVNHAVNVALDSSDSLSGVATTQYSLDDGAAQTGDSVAIDTEGVHTLAYWSTDKAGNEEAHKTISIQIDKTAPTINHTQSPAANANGWNNGDVTVTFSCGDAGAGLLSCTAPQTATGEGQSLAVHGTAEDNAGNVSHDEASLNIDRTAPTIGEAAGRPAPNANGWYNGSITITFECADALSGVAACSAPVVVGHGASQHVDGHATDNAGNTRGKNVSGLNVDTGAPTISGAPTSSPNVDGWYAGDVVIHWTCGDDLSGIDAPCPANTTIIGEGAALSATATIHDLAGNSASATVGNIHIDRNAPVTTDDVPNGWHNSAVTVHFSVTDNLSGPHHTNYKIDGGATSSGSSVVVGQGNHTVTYWSTDKAGNIESVKTVPVLVDTTAPAITGAATTLPNSSGWYRGPITVHFTCTDGLSGLASCPADVTLSGDGANQSVSGTAIDNAGNQTSTTVTGLNLDHTAPSITFQGVTNGATYTLGAAPTPSCTASDALSGVAQTCAGTLTGGNANGVGQFSYSATVTDRAGNSTTSAVTFRVGYRFDGFLQPINDTAHQIGTSTSIFKAGSTVPVKFQLRRADGTVVQSVTAPQWLTPSKGAATSAAVDESLYSVASTGGDTYRADGTTQYIYNWGTDKNAAGFYWRIGVRLDDGSTYYVNIGLR